MVEQTDLKDKLQQHWFVDWIKKSKIDWLISFPIKVGSIKKEYSTAYSKNIVLRTSYEVYYNLCV